MAFYCSFSWTIWKSKKHGLIVYVSTGYGIKNKQRLVMVGSIALNKSEYSYNETNDNLTKIWKG